MKSLFTLLTLLAVATLSGCASGKHATYKPVVHAAVDTGKLSAVVKEAGVSAKKLKTQITASAASNSRAAAVAAKIRDKGAAANSPEAAQLVLEIAATDSALAAGNLTIDGLELQLGIAGTTIVQLKADVDKQTVAANAAEQKAADFSAKAAYWETKHDEAVKIIWWYRVRFWGPIILAVVAIGLLLVARFTEWGAKTIAPLARAAAPI